MNETARPTLICLTPVKDEAWILERSLRCASQWADHIVVADQQSTDGSRAIARGFPKVTLVDNDAPGWDERARQHLLIDTARRLPAPGKRILIALDADEALTANWQTSPEWQTLLQAPEGTRIGFRWINVLPGYERTWIPPDTKWFGLVDDGTPHDAIVIHGPRLPEPEGAPTLVLDDVATLHFQYTDWARMESKQRWYQAWERLTFPEKRPITVYRQYNFMHALPERELHPLRSEWLAAYEEAGIDMRSVRKDEQYRWDETVVEMLEEHGPQTFRKMNIWNQDWERIRRALGRPPKGPLRDPRTLFEKAVHAWLARTQPYANHLLVRATQKLLQPLGW